MIWKKTLFVVVLLSFFAIGCSGQQKAEKKSKSQEKVVATVNKNEITAPDIDALFAQMQPFQRQQYVTDEGKKQLIDQVIDTFLLADKARAEKMDESPEYLSQKKFAENQILAQRYVHKIIDETKVTDEDAKKYYEENKEKYTSGQVKASHILVKTKEEADSIRQELQENPKKFEDIAKARSIDTGSGAKGGDLGWFVRGRMVKPFEDAAFSLKKGEISKPVQTQFGFHIIRLDDKTEVAQKPLEDVKEEIKTSMLQDKQKKVLEETLAKLKKEGAVKINEAELKETGTKFLPSAAPAAPGAGQ